MTLSMTDLYRRAKRRAVRWSLTHRSVPVCGVPFTHPAGGRWYCTRGPSHDGAHMMIHKGRTIVWRTPPRKDVND